MTKWAFYLARQIYESEIWLTKPSWWLKVWIYILWSVRYSDSSTLKRWEWFLSIKQIYECCFLAKDSLKPRTVENVITWLKCKGQITVEKTGHWFIVKVHNYDLYQDLEYYTNGTENGTKNGRKTEQKRNGSGTLYKERNKVNKEKKIIKEKKFYNLKNSNDEIQSINPDSVNPLGNKPF